MAHHTPGWNDPPPLSFSQCTPSTKRTLLNKRVPFPLTQVSPVPSTEIPNIIPDTATSVHPNCGSNIACSKEVEKPEIDDPIPDVPEEEILSIVMGSLEKILSQHSDRYEKKKIEEINRRLDVMKSSWNTKISVLVKHKMLKLAEELSKGNAEAALKIQCVLMVDHLREVKQWMVGVKHIIEMERLSSSANETLQDCS